MQVLVVTNMYPSEQAPFYGIFVKEQVESIRKEGVEVDVVFINGRESRLNYFLSVTELIKKLKSKKYDMLHAHHTYCVYPLAITKTIMGMKTPLILTFHEGEVHNTKEFKTKELDFVKRFVFSKRVKKFALKMVNLVITVQKELVDRVRFNGKYVVMPCGVDSDLFHPMEKKWCRKKLNLPLNKKLIFFPASPKNKNKGFELLSESIKYLRNEDIQLITAGNIAHHDVPYYMCASDVVVQLSRFEASPMVLKETMSVNVPAVFTETGDVKSTIGNTKGYFLCARTPQDVALKLKNAIDCNGDSGGRKRISDTGLKLSDIATKIIKIYDELLQAH